MAASASTWPLVGRDDELELIADVLRRSDGARSLVVAGAAGVGKTRLAMEVLAAQAETGTPTARVVASRAASSIPLGAMAPLLPEAAQPPDSRVGLLRQAAVALAARATAEGGPLLLAVDDAHLLDDTSATLVQQLAVEGSVRLLLTVRTGEPVPDAVAALWKDGYAERLELQRLSRAEVEELAGVALEGTIDGALVQQLWTASQGNALYLRELILGALDAGAIRRDGRLWRSSGPLGAPPRLVELVEARLAGLSEEELGAVDLLAVAETLGLTTLEQVVGAGALETLERRGVVVVTPDERRRPVRLAHPLYGEIRRRTLPSTRLRSEQRRLADLIEGVGARRRDDVLRLALLRLDADGTADPGLLIDATRQAWFTYDSAMEERLARAAVAAGGGTPAVLLLAEVLRWSGRHEEAEELLQPVTLEEAGEENFAVVCLNRAQVLFRGLGRHEEALAVVEGGLASIVDPSWWAELEAERGSLAIFSGEVTAGLDILEPLLATTTGRPYVSVAALAVPALALAGRADEAVALADDAFPLALALGRGPTMGDPAVFMVGRCLALAYCGRLEEARLPAQLGYDWSVTTGIPVGQAWFGMILGLVELSSGGLARATALFEEAALGFRDQHDRLNARWCLSGLGLAAAWRGDGGSGRAALEEADALGMRCVGLMDAEVERAWAAVEAGRGDLDAARTRLVAAAGVARERGQASLEGVVLHDLVRLAGPGAVDPAVRSRLAELAETGQGPLPALRRDHAAAVADRDGPRLEEVSDALERLGARLYAAEASAHAAVVHRAQGLEGRSSVAAARAGALAEACDGAVTPALAAISETGRRLEALTPRELEVARLAAEGRSNREIAESLFVSVRTVENQLQRAYSKLGVSGRTDLRAALGPK